MGRQRYPMAARATRRRHAPHALAQHRSSFHIDGGGGPANSHPLAREPPSPADTPPNRWGRSDEVRLATSEYRVRKTIRHGVAGPSAQGPAGLRTLEKAYSAGVR